MHEIVGAARSRLRLRHPRPGALDERFGRCGDAAAEALVVVDAVRIVRGAPHAAVVAAIGTGAADV